MGDSISAIYDDMEEYVDRCKKYQEPVQKAADGWADCYGEHAHKLKAREHKEYEEKRAREISGAEFSDDGVYRYRLWRKWREGPSVMFIMLNPSTADETVNDPTVERCQRRAMEYGFGRLEVTNLFALRSTDPKALYKHKNPFGPDNKTAILTAATKSNMIICGWGVHGSFCNRGEIVKKLLLDNGHSLHVLRLTKKGIPGHPLYIPYSARPQLWV